MTIVRIMPMQPDHLAGAVALQRLCFPPPFPESYLWGEEDLEQHLARFPEGQFIALAGDLVVGSSSNNRIPLARWDQRLNWYETNGGPWFEGYDENGDALYGADISVHPEFRRMGIGRELYASRFELVQTLGLKAYITGCRVPGLKQAIQEEGTTLEQYVREVSLGTRNDRVITPLLKMGLTLVGWHDDYMMDEESCNSGALLEWRP